MKIFIFDLDDTILDTSTHLVPHAARKSCQSLIDDGLPASLEELLLLREQWGVYTPHRKLFYNLILKFAPEWSELKKIEASQKASYFFYHPEIPEKLPLMEDVERVLLNSQQHFINYLVSSGDPKIQAQKVKSLNVSKFFKECIYVNNELGERKFDAFRNICISENCHPNEILCLGNRLNQEIKDSKLLGTLTCYIAHGEHKGESPARREEIPDFTIENWAEFKKIETHFFKNQNGHIK